MARRPHVRDRGRQRVTVDADATPRRFSPTTLLLVAALVILGAAYWFYLDGGVQGTGAVTSRSIGRGQQPALNTGDVTTTVRVEPISDNAPSEPQVAAEVEEVPLANTVTEFAIPATQARYTVDPMRMYIRLATSRVSRRAVSQPTKPTVPLPAFDDAPASPPPPPWIQQWAKDNSIRYVAYIDGKRPGAVISTKDGETVVFAGEMFPGSKDVRVTKIFPTKVVLLARGHYLEVKK